MNDIVKPTCSDLCEESETTEVYKLVSQNHDTSWRHGTRETDVFHRESDDTYWQAKYRLSTDGETNELREGLADISQVWPQQVMKTVYTTERPK